MPPLNSSGGRRDWVEYPEHEEDSALLFENMQDLYSHILGFGH